MDWTEELKNEVIKQYVDAKPTAENSMAIVKEIADNIDGTTVNGVRTILTKAEVYVKVAKAATPSGTDDKKPARVSKADSQEALTIVIESLGKVADQDIIGKMTGKAAAYFAKLMKAE